MDGNRAGRRGRLRYVAASWAALFMAHGGALVATDPRPEPRRNSKPEGDRPRPESCAVAVCWRRCQPRLSSPRIDPHPASSGLAPFASKCIIRLNRQCKGWKRWTT